MNGKWTFSWAFSLLALGVISMVAQSQPVPKAIAARTLVDRNVVLQPVGRRPIGVGGGWLGGVPLNPDIDEPDKAAWPGKLALQRRVD